MLGSFFKIHNAMEEGTRWANITPDDHSGVLYIVTFISFTYSNLTFLARLLIKWHMLGLDDLAMLLAQVLISCSVYFLPSATKLTTTDCQHSPIRAFACFHVSWARENV